MGPVIIIRFLLLLRKDWSGPRAEVLNWSNNFFTALGKTFSEVDRGGRFAGKDKFSFSRNRPHWPNVFAPNNAIIAHNSTLVNSTLTLSYTH